MQKKHILKILLAGAFLSLWYGSFHQAFQAEKDLSTSVLSPSSQEVPAFNGLTMPVEKMPDWVALGSEKWNTPYTQISSQQLIPVPSYDLSVLKIPRKNLNAEKPADRAALNAKSFYLAIYLGNYRYSNLEFDGQENVGSHTGVDMRLPKGTPIRAIGNGRVVQVAFDTIGFGTHLVIEHPNFPSLEDPDKKTTYYSSYSHLDSIVVKEGDVVLKGQLVGKSGQTGYASLPHLHFQIDTDKAPWHPYWPFTLKEAEAAGYSYADAVNNGLGKEKAKVTTIHPLEYIQKYRNTSFPSHGSAPEKAALAGPQTLAMLEPVKPPTEEWKTVNSALSGLLLQRPFRDVPVRGELTSALQFLKIHKVVEGYNDGTFQASRTVSRAEAPKFILASVNKDPEIPNVAPFKDVPRRSWFAPAIASAKALAMVQGYSDGAYRPQLNVSRAEFLKMLVQAWKISLPKAPSGRVYSDVSSSHWASAYIQFAKTSGLLDAKITRFRPDQAITRGEAAILMYRMIQLQLSGQKYYGPGVVVADAEAVKFFQ